MTLLRSVACSLLATSVVGSAIPRGFYAPDNNGFPNPSDEQKVQIAMQAGGLIPNTPPPTKLGANSITAFQLIAANEIFETSYFSSLLNNITSGAAGYTDPNSDKLAESFRAILAQEEEHALTAVSILNAVGAFAPSSCEYMFPATDLVTAVNIAETFTDIVLGALQGANVLFAMDGDFDPIQTISSVIGQEGEQNGYYRQILDRHPSESPFLTAVPAAFAWSALQMFVVPGSCPYPLSNINLPIYPPIMTNGGPIAFLEPQDQTLSFQSDVSSNSAAQPFVGKTDGLFVTYTNGQTIPVSVPATNVQWSGSTVSFQASFPYTANVFGGFTHGALTTQNTFATANDVPAAALAGPAAIQVNDCLG